MTEKHSIAIIGCGMIAGRFQNPSDAHTYSHAKAIMENSNFGRIGFYDPDSEKSAKMARKYQGADYTSIETMLKKLQPAVVTICSPDQLHFEQVLKVVQSDCCPRIVFVEKPVCRSLTELEAMITLQDQYPEVAIFVNHSRRFDSKHLQLAAAIRQGKYGRFDYCRVDYYGGWGHNGIHLIDFLDLCFDEEIEVSSARYACESKYPDDKTLHIQGVLAGGEICFRGHTEDYFQVTEIDLFFEKGRILISDFGMQIDCYKKGVNAENETVLFYDAESSGKAMFDQIVRAYRELADYLNGNDSEILNSVRLDRVAYVMKHLWKVGSSYDELSD